MVFKYAGVTAVQGVYLIMEYIPSYKIEGFEGPLDLLLQLIARNKLNIYDIQLSVLIDQYLKANFSKWLQGFCILKP